MTATEDWPSGLTFSLQDVGQQLAEAIRALEATHSRVAKTVNAAKHASTFLTGLIKVKKRSDRRGGSRCEEERDRRGRIAIR